MSTRKVVAGNLTENSKKVMVPLLRWRRLARCAARTADAASFVIKLALAAKLQGLLPHRHAGMRWNLRRFLPGHPWGASSSPPPRSLDGGIVHPVAWSSSHIFRFGMHAGSCKAATRCSRCTPANSVEAVQAGPHGRLSPGRAQRAGCGEDMPSHTVEGTACPVALLLSPGS